MDSQEKRLNSALDLFRRLPPAHLEMNLQFVTEMMPDLADDLLQTVDCPLKSIVDTDTGKEFLTCDYNRDGDSYRSPFSNKYFPALEDDVDPILPPENLRQLEVDANNLFRAYCDQYYDGGLSSVYFWEVDDGFAACVLFKKDGSGLRGAEKGCWDSIHVVEVLPKGNEATYKLTTTIMLSLKTSETNLDLSGSVQKQEIKEKVKFDKVNTHLVNMGNLIQKMENTMRDQLQTVYFDKARQVTRALRATSSKSEREASGKLASELQSVLGNRRR